MSRYDDIKNLVESMEDDLNKFYNKANKAAGTRARKGLQDLKNLAQEVRMDIQKSKNNM